MGTAVTGTLSVPRITLGDVQSNATGADHARRRKGETLMTTHRPTANPQMAAAMRGKRTSSAAGPHADRRTKRRRTRGARVRAAIRAELE